MKLYTYEYSDVKSVRRINSSSENFALGVYPTVAQSINEVELVAAGCRPGDSFEIVLINSIGIEIGKTVVDVSADGEVRLVPFASLTVPSGIYTLAVETGSLRHFKSVIIR